ncbi:hypothetical protein HPB47_012781 [Ixodes persulcatus]|uniref:Uncharacterized protein n=1 Tax=Ixodes persulcatus TaxID=34615 RepID=A0AC60NSM3_IXOPE|nr:hypothetical protein HPB47_012781 [Ixodes persulcatus]
MRVPSGPFVVVLRGGQVEASCLSQGENEVLQILGNSRECVGGQPRTPWQSSRGKPGWHHRGPGPRRPSLLGTPSPENATRYSRLTKYTYREKEWEVAAYVVPPENTQRGVIQGIPPEDSDQDILENLFHSRNPSVLHARRMGRSNSVLILFEGDRVPFWVRYGNVDFRCCIYKKKVEIYTTCGSVGHRGDVCSDPTDRLCNACYALNPAPTHDCLPFCGICGKSHPTGDKKCKLLYKTPHILVKRKWDRLQQAAEERTPFQPNSIDFPPLPPVSRSRSRTPAKRQNPRIPSRSRSRSRQRVGGAQTVQWGAPPASESTRESKDKTANHSRNSDLSDLRRMVTQLRDENRRLLDRLEQTEQECANLRQQLQAGATLPTPDPEATSPPVKRKMATRSKSPAPEREGGSSVPVRSTGNLPSLCRNVAEPNVARQSSLTTRPPPGDTASPARTPCVNPKPTSSGSGTVAVTARNADTSNNT